MPVYLDKKRGTYYFSGTFSTWIPAYLNEILMEQTASEDRDFSFPVW